MIEGKSGHFQVDLVHGHSAGAEALLVLLCARLESTDAKVCRTLGAQLRLQLMRGHGLFETIEPQLVVAHGVAVQHLVPSPLCSRQRARDEGAASSPSPCTSRW